MTTEPTRRAVLRSGLALALVALAGCTGSRQDKVAARGADVMPFDLERTTHRFTPQTNGLLEEVIADDTSDTEQIELIREHLQHESARFRDGDFADPARIHGDDMPGLTELHSGADRINISYGSLPAGASIRFRTAEPQLVRALHAWGEAQVADHGGHAERGN